MNTERFKNFLAETFFPKSFTCDICGVETFKTNLCPDCAETVDFIGEGCCPVCGRKTVRPEICLECKEKPPLFKKAVSAFVYENGGVLLIKKFKDGNGYLKEYFADLLAEKIKNLPAADCIVYVPMTKKAQRRRGYNQSELLAYSLSKRINIPVIKDALKKVKETDEQKSLAKSERAKNLSGCFAVNKPEEIKGKNILLADDVMTTGVTAEEITRALLAAGALNVYSCAVASVEYKITKTDNASDIKSKKDVPHTRA
ncbi:MAG: ComF family protein [Clostridia bacterium]|nr:ComF family protein [Clostridia bacterium]